MSSVELESLKLTVESCQNHINELTVKVAGLEAKIDMILSKSNDMDKLLKYVVLPLIIIMGALVGVKIALP